MNQLRSLSALIQDFQTLLCNRTIFYLIIPCILFQWHLALLKISWTTACHKQHHSVISTNYWATSHFLKQQRTLCSFLSSIFQTVYETIFSRSKLADNPKPWRISLILEIVYGGWTLIRHTVMAKFLRFKDAEYGTLFTLLDSYIPLVLSIYSISFKLNNFSEYFRAMIRIWIMFTCLQRRHYYKALLVWINMCSHWGKHAPQLYNLLRNYIAFSMNILWKTPTAYSVHR